MRLLILGGTRFVGHAVASAAFSLGWEVTTFNRSLSGPDVAGVRVLRGDRAQAADLAAVAAAGPWDAVIDTSGYVPCEVLAACKRLEPLAARYVFMSSVSVYRGWPVEPLSEALGVLYCPPDAGPADFTTNARRSASSISYHPRSPNLVAGSAPDRTARRTVSGLLRTTLAAWLTDRTLIPPG